jgi:hypothetical protein
MSFTEKLQLAFGAGWFIIPLLAFIGFAISTYKANRAIKSGSTTRQANGELKEGGNVTFLQTGAGKFALGFAVATIAILLVRFAEI